jgi:hypothetical protein
MMPEAGHAGLQSLHSPPIRMPVFPLCPVPPVPVVSTRYACGCHHCPYKYSVGAERENARQECPTVQ